MTSPICFSNYLLYICIITAVSGNWTISMLMIQPHRTPVLSPWWLIDAIALAKCPHHSSSCLCRPCFCVPAVTQVGVFRKQRRHWLGCSMVVMVNQELTVLEASGEDWQQCCGLNNQQVNEYVFIEFSGILGYEITPLPQLPEWEM